jgi:ssDNA thymidine ADP-ribosyltransferase, DarT
MDTRVTEFHCIMPLHNISSVMRHGILSYESAAKLAHHSVAMQPVQDLRDQKTVPGGLRLHQYANLYFHARNPMLYVRMAEASNLCVLRVATSVLQIQGTVVSDQNAASNYVRFYAPSQLRLLPFDDIFAHDWTHPDRITYWRQKARKCAEVLVPNSVPPESIEGAYVVDQGAAVRLAAFGFRDAIAVNAALFFR